MTLKDGIMFGSSRTPRVDLIMDSVKVEQELTKSRGKEAAKLEDGLLRNSSLRKPEAHCVRHTLQAGAAPGTREPKTIRKKLDKKRENAGNLEKDEDKLVGFADGETCFEEGTRSDEEVETLEEKVARLENHIQRLSLVGSRNTNNIKDLEERILQLENNIHGAPQDGTDKADNCKDFSSQLAAQTQKPPNLQGEVATLEAEAHQASQERGENNEDVRNFLQPLAARTGKASALEENIARLEDIIDNNHTERKQKTTKGSQQVSFLRDLQEIITEMEKQLSLVNRNNEEIEGLKAQITGQFQQLEATSGQLTKLGEKLSDERTLRGQRVASQTLDPKEEAGVLVRLKDSYDQKSRELKEKEEKIRELEDDLAKRCTQPGNEDSAVLGLKRQLQEKSQELKDKDLVIKNLKYQQAQQATSHDDELRSLEKSSEVALHLVAKKDEEIEDVRRRLKEEIRKLALEKAETGRLQILLKESSLAISAKELEIESIRNTLDEETRRSGLERQEHEKIMILFKESSLIIGEKVEEIKKIEEELDEQKRRGTEREVAIEKLSRDYAIAVAKKDEEVQNLKTSLHNETQAAVAFREDLEGLRRQLQLKRDENGQQVEQIEELRRKAKEDQGYGELQKRDSEQQQSGIGNPKEEGKKLHQEVQDKKGGMPFLTENNASQENKTIELRGQIEARGLEVEKLLQQIEAQKAEVITQRNKAEKYLTEVEDLRISHQEAMNDASAVTATLQKELDEARKQLLSDQSKHVEEVEKIRLGHIKQLEHVSVSRNQVKLLRLEFQKMQEKHEIYIKAIADAKDEVNEKEERQRKLLLELGEVRLEHKKLLEQAFVQRDQVKKLKLEVGRLEETNIIRLKAISDSHDELEEKKAAEGRLTIEIDKLEGDIKDLQEKLDSLRRINEGLIAGKAEETLRAEIAVKDARITDMNRKLSQQDKQVRGAQDAALKMVEIKRSQKLQLPEDNLMRGILEVELELRPKEWAKKYALPDFSDGKGKAESKLEDQLAMIAGQGKGLKDLSRKYEPDILVNALLLQYIKDNVLSKPFLAFWDEGGREFAMELMRCYDDLLEGMLIVNPADEHLLTGTIEYSG